MPSTVPSAKCLVHPVPRLAEGLRDDVLWRPRLHPVVVLPSSSLGERHEDGLDASTSLQAEDSAAVVYEVELHVPA